MIMKGCIGDNILFLVVERDWLVSTVQETLASGSLFLRLDTDIHYRIGPNLRLSRCSAFTSPHLRRISKHHCCFSVFYACPLLLASCSSLHHLLSSLLHYDIGSLAEFAFLNNDPALKSKGCCRGT